MPASPRARRPPAPDWFGLVTSPVLRCGAQESRKTHPTPVQMAVSARLKAGIRRTSLVPPDHVEIEEIDQYMPVDEAVDEIPDDPAENQSEGDLAVNQFAHQH